MANQIRLKRASGSDPGASDLVTGELAVRTDTGKLFTKKDDNSVAEIGVTGNAATATKLETARTIAGVSFDGSANISLNNNAITNGAGYITATLTNEQVQDIVGGMLTGNTETGITVTYQDGDGTIDFVVGTLNQDTTGNAATATALETARNIGGVSFDGTGNINLPGVNTSGNQNTTGSAATLTTARNIGGVSFDGSANINLPGVNTSGNQDTSGNAATATKLATARTIAGVSFDGSANISLNNNAITNGAGYITATLSNEQVQDIVGGMVSGNTESGISVTYDDSGNKLNFSVGTLNQDTTGNAATATALETARTIAGVSFDGTSNISLNNNAITNGAGYITSADGGNAATLDGIDSSQFLRSDANDTTSHHITFNDNAKAKFGTGGDLEIYHDGSDSYLKDGGTGGVKILTNNFSVNNAGDSENIIHATQDGAVQLYHNGTEMFKTTAFGVTLTKNCQAPLSTLTDGSTITVDFSTASHFTVTLGGNRTFGDPGSTGSAVGSSGSIFIIQDGTGSRTASFHADYKFVGGTAPTLSTAANAVDRIDYVVKESNVVHCAISLDVK